MYSQRIQAAGIDTGFPLSKHHEQLAVLLMLTSGEVDRGDEREAG